MMQEETIAAISTPPGEGGIAIVRLSGPEALTVADRLYQMGRKKLAAVESHTIHYGHIVDPARGEVVDEVMVSVMKAPRTYTKEDVVEINTHGGIVATQRVLELCLTNGARLAEPGEFTKRAFLNGRIDLSQAEAVMDVIRAKTDRGMAQAVKQLGGDLSRAVRALRGEILETLAQVEVNIDYPEYDDVEEMTTRLMKERGQGVLEKIEELLAHSRQGKILREGLQVAIIGRPNVGKSSLLNALLREEKAIVTDIEGTTRDVIEEYVSVRGVPLHLIDTAGIRETDDVVEQIGVERSRAKLAEAELVLLVLDASEKLQPEDIELLESTAERPRLVLLNKTDLPERLDRHELAEEHLAGSDLIDLSLVEGEGIDDLETYIADLFFKGGTGEREHVTLFNTRHIALLEAAAKSIGDMLGGIDAGLPVDLVQMDLTRAWELLGEITGDTAQDELLDQLFSQFCLGK